MNAFDYFFEYSKNLDKQFVLGATEQVSYADVYAHSLKIARYLQQKIGKNKRVLLISNNSVFFIKSYFAILKSGNIVVPINPEIEGKNLDYVINKSNPELVFMSQRFFRFFPTISNEVVNEIKLEEIIRSNVNDINLELENVIDYQIAEIIFTSGSTGEPKGVVLSHKNLISNTESILSYLKIGSNDIMQVVLPFYYCYGLSLLHTHARVGGSLVLTNSFMFLATVISDLKSYKCTGFAGVPSHFQMLLRKTKDFKNTELPDLRYVTQAGGKLHNSFIEEFTNAFPKIDFYVMYGQTEATARLTYLPPHDLKNKMGSIGKAIPGVQIAILSAQGNFASDGEVGEIVAKGDNIMLGYFEDTELTRETIVDSWLHTGDLGYTDDQGYIFITGRKRDFIKVGGNRLSSKEIEAVVLEIPYVIDCTISAVYDELWGESIKAEIIVNNKEDITPEYIREYCSKKLIRFKVPQVIEFKTEMNLNGNGKKVKAVSI